MKKTICTKLVIASIIIIGANIQNTHAQCTLFSENFASSFGSQFTSSNNTGGSTWAFTNSCSASNLAGHTAPGSVIFQSATVPCQFGNSTSTVSGNLNTPQVNISSAGTTTLNFNYYLLNECTGTCPNDKLSVGISTNGGASFTTIMDSYLTGGLAPTAGAWVAKSYNLSAYAGQNIIVRFSFNSVNGTANAFDGVYIDDVAIIATAGPAMPAAIAGSSAVCMNTSASYSISPVTAAATYTWSVPPGASISSGQGTASVAVLYGTSSGNLSVAAVNSCGTSAAKTLSVTVSVPSLTASAATSICQGDSTQLTATSNVPSASTYTLGTGTITNSSTGYPAPYGNEYWGARHQMLITASELTALGMVAGQITSLAFDVSAVNTAPIHQGFTIQMGATSLTSITAFQSGLSTVYGPVDYQPVVGWNTHTFSTPFIWNGTSNIIVETCFNNSSWISNASVRQSTTPYTSIVYHYQDASGVCGSATTSSTKSQRPNMKFDAAASITYSWSPSSGLSSSFISNPQASPSATTTYTVTGISNCGSVSDVVTVTVNPSVTSANAGNDVTICESWSAALNGSGSGGTNYLWSTGQTTASIVVAPSVSSTYTLVVSNASGCSKSDEVTVTVNPAATANAGADFTICNGQIVLINGSGSNGNFSWSPSTGLSCTNCPNPGASPSSTTSYTLTVANNCGSASDVVTVIVDMATASAGSDVTICPGGNVLLNGMGNGSYDWAPATGLSCTTCPDPVASPVSTTTYTLTVTSSCSSASDVIVVTVDSLFTANANAGNDVTICPGGNVLLNGMGNGSYDWAPATGLSCTTCPDPVASPVSTTTYTLTVTSSCGSASDDISVAVYPLTTANAGSDITICKDSSAMLSATGNGSYSWTPAAGLSCTTCPDPAASPALTTTYTLMVTSNCGSAEDFITVTVNPCVTGIAAVIPDEEIKIAPNPGEGVFLLTSGEKIYGEVVIEVMNFQGKVIYSNKRIMHKKGILEIDIRKAPAGVYLLRDSTGNGCFMRKIVSM